jgi:glutathione synthase/RimK-type ligase-like ATP-grasp enzyme
MKAWLLTTLAPKSDWYETWRFVGEMRKRGLDTIHINPSQWTRVGSDFYVNDKKLDQPDIIVLRYAVWDTKPLRQIQPLLDRGTFIYNKLQPHIDALDKVTAHPKYIDANIPVPKTEIIDFNNDDAFDIISDKIGWPCVIKWRFSAGSNNVYLCHSPEDIYPIIREFIEIHRRKVRMPYKYCKGLVPDNKQLDLKMIAQEYLDLDYMFRVHTIRGRHIIANMQIHGLSLKGYDKFKGNFSSVGMDNPPDGRIHLATRPTAEMKDLVGRTLEALDLEWGAIDVFPTKDGLKICEINPTANIVTTEGSSFRNVTGFMIDHILEGYRSHRY